MYKPYKIIYKILYAIAEYCNKKADKYYAKCENILEDKYNQEVEDFYENGLGYYGEK